MINKILIIIKNYFYNQDLKQRLNTLRNDEILNMYNDLYKAGIYNLKERDKREKEIDIAINNTYLELKK